jgi:hypothetical protein
MSSRAISLSPLRARSFFHFTYGWRRGLYPCAAFAAVAMGDHSERSSDIRTIVPFGGRDTRLDSRRGRRRYLLISARSRCSFHIRKRKRG